MVGVVGEIFETPEGALVYALENCIVDLYFSTAFILFIQPLAHNRIFIYIENMVLYSSYSCRTLSIVLYYV